MPGYRDRESIVPMDFEYDNRFGPVDSQSPFISHASNKRTHSVFDSPSKSTFATPNHPKLSDPNGQRFLFSQPSSKPLPLPLPQTPQNNKVWDLRTPQSIFDSSGGETPNTPALDSEAATPDTQLAITMGALSHGERKSPSKRSSFFKSLPWNKSPSKDKSSREKPYSKKAENRVLKRRSHKSRTRHNENDSEAESPIKDVNIQQAAPAIGFAARIPGVLAWVEAHPNLPNVLSFYMQFIVNVALGVLFLYIVYIAISAVMADIDNEASNKVRDIMHEIAICAQDYERNGCEPNPVPAIESLCQNWKRCMERDAYKVARSSVGARTFASIINSFVDEFSYKSMLFTAMLLFGGFNVSNWAFGFWREKAQPHPQHHEYPPIPQTPQRYPSGGYMVDHAGWQHTPGPYETPYGTINRPMLQATQSMPALPSTQEETLKSPSKKAVRR